MKRFISAVVVLIGLAASAWADTKACEDSWERRGYGAALKECRPLAELGDVKAQYELGNMYYLGMGAPQDDASHGLSLFVPSKRRSRLYRHSRPTCRGGRTRFFRLEGQELF